VSILNVEGSETPEICSGVFGTDDNFNILREPSIRLIAPLPVDNELIDSSTDFNLLTMEA